MSAHRLHIFNPDTDYALASDREFYTPPKHVVELRKKMALLPARYASRGDAILMMDMPDRDLADLEYFDLAADRGIQILLPDESLSSSFDAGDFIVDPWGWNKNVRRFIEDILPDVAGLPSDTDLFNHRMLSHRRTTIRMFEQLDSILSNEIRYPVEIREVDIAMDMYHMNQPLYFKAPWSSSGRGILFTDGLEPRHVEPWLRGIIRKQGSVIMEIAYDRKLDFATEWIIEDGQPQFIGLSVFNVSRRGKYHSNVKGSQQQLADIIKSACPSWNDGIIVAQQDALKQVVNGKYSGPIGIDMLVTASGNINPCVEMNFRHTMGIVELLSVRS